MGNSSSSAGKSQQDDTVDFGYLIPCGVYSGPRDWNQAITSQLICARRLAPFYRPLEDYQEDWDDDQILSARKDFPNPEEPNLEHTTSRTETTISSGSTIRSSKDGKRSGNLKEPAKPEAAIYRGAVECPICFLYYPPNINHSRCCDQAICTECFVQIKRAEPTTTHVVSEPACCPYCVQENFGVVYTPPPWRAGIGSDGSFSPWSDPSRPTTVENAPYPTHKRRQKSFSADSPEVVTVDQIRPDWEAKLAAVRAAVARRANRRIIMRQVGDRLIPVGVTSGRVHALSPEEAAAAAAEGADGSISRRSRRRHQGGNSAFEQYIGLAGPDLEELMVMEAMRLSLLEHEEQQKKEAEEKRKAAAAQAASNGESSLAAGSSSPTRASGFNPPSSPVPPTMPSSSSSNPLSSIRDSLRAGLSGRSRSPSPNPSTVGKRASNPPAFSTLSAALSTTATASAVLANGKEPANSSEASTASGGSSSSVPVISVEDGEAQQQVQESASQLVSPAPSEQTQNEAGKPYERLVSSPESSVVSEPLLSQQSQVSDSSSSSLAVDSSKDTPTTATEAGGNEPGY